MRTYSAARPRGSTSVLPKVSWRRPLEAVPPRTIDGGSVASERPPKPRRDPILILKPLESRDANRGGALRLFPQRKKLSQKRKNFFRLPPKNEGLGMHPPLRRLYRRS